MCRGKRLCYSWWAASPIEILLITNILWPRRPAEYIFSRFCFCAATTKQGASYGEFCKSLGTACPRRRPAQRDAASCARPRAGGTACPTTGYATECAKSCTKAAPLLCPPPGSRTHPGGARRWCALPARRRPSDRNPAPANPRAWSPAPLPSIRRHRANTRPW